MARKRTLIGAVLLTVLVVMTGVHSLSNTAPALAQTSASYNLEWHVIGGGGQPVASAHYVVNSTVGQGAASPPYSSSSAYVVRSGFWFVPRYLVYLPLIQRDS